MVVRVACDVQADEPGNEDGYVKLSRDGLKH